MTTERTGRLQRRAARHRALGDAHRLRIVDALRTSDRTPSDLGRTLGMPSNLVAFHLEVLEEVGLVTRTVSEGDARRRYVSLLEEPDAAGLGEAPLPADPVLFVCTANSARSQLAAALWRSRTGRGAASAGTAPAAAVHPFALVIAARHGLDLGAAVPRHLDDVEPTAALVVTVCDRANEARPASPAPHVHWSVPDPARGDEAVFEATYRQLATRVARLATLSGHG